MKRYSSGMYVRLAFAVAAHLEPEILIVDEVLAVGDAEFQKKCLGKMNEVSRQGRPDSAVRQPQHGRCNKLVSTRNLARARHSVASWNRARDRKQVPRSEHVKSPGCNARLPFIGAHRRWPFSI